MAEQSKIALIAVRMAPGPRTTQPQAIIIGTKAPWTQPLPDGKNRKWEAGQDWRYACYPLEVFRALFNKDPQLDPFDTSIEASPSWATVDVLKKSMLQTAGLLTSTDQDALEAVGFSTTYLNKSLTVLVGEATLKPTRRQTAIPLRHVERAFFFSNEKGATAEGPFAALDTSRLVLPKGDDVPHSFDADAPKDKWPTGSRLILFPDFTDPDRPGALTAISAHLGINVAINGHRVSSAAEKRAEDRYDTRILLDLGLREGGTGIPKKNLWVTKSGTQKPLPLRGLRFDRMQLRCTVAPFMNGSGVSRSDPVIVATSDLLTFAHDSSTKRGKIDINTVNQDDFRVYHVPALSALGMADQAILASREFGFRALRCKKDGSSPPSDDRIDKIGWRFELWASDYSDSFLGNLASKAVVPKEVRAALGNKLTLFAEAPSRAPMAFSMNLIRPPKATRERAAIRLEPDFMPQPSVPVLKYAALRYLDRVALLEQRWSWRGRPHAEIPVNAIEKFGEDCEIEAAAKFVDMAFIGRSDDDIGTIHEMRITRAHAYRGRPRFEFSPPKKAPKELKAPVVLERELDYRGGANLWRFALRAKSRYRRPFTRSPGP